MTKHKSQDERRSQILAAAKRCFIRNGYADTRVDDIAAEAELS
jgi:AcrR family transcriptional regulator